MNLKTAIKNNLLDKFIEEHEPADPHPDGESRLFQLMELMFSGMQTDAGTSDGDVSADYSETQTRPDISEDV